MSYFHADPNRVIRVAGVTLMLIDISRRVRRRQRRIKFALLPVKMYFIHGTEVLHGQPMVIQPEKKSLVCGPFMEHEGNSHTHVIRLF